MQSLKFIFPLLIINIFINQANSQDQKNLRPESLELIEENTQSYNMYVFALQWGKSVCITSSTQSICNSKLTAIPSNYLSIHGLWPTLKNGTFLDSCNTGTNVTVSSGTTFMQNYWPSLSGTNSYFWSYEYNKHGYCYTSYIGSTDPYKYFSKAQTIYEGKSLGLLIKNAIGSQSAGEYSISLSNLISKLNSKLGGKYYGLVCKTSNSKQYLYEIRITLDLNFNYIASTLSDSTCSSSKNVIIYYR